ncbi:hypothetical protein BPY_12490 [Bifidobacterium psychraerophilum]
MYCAACLIRAVTHARATGNTLLVSALKASIEEQCEGYQALSDTSRAQGPTNWKES